MNIPPKVVCLVCLIYKFLHNRSNERASPSIELCRRIDALEFCLPVIVASVCPEQSEGSTKKAMSLRKTRAEGANP